MKERSSLDITGMNMLEYYLAFAENHTALTHHYAKQAAEEGGLYCARIEKAYAGYICVADEKDTVRINYAFTEPEFRDQGVFTGLVQYVAHAYQKPVSLGILTSSDFYGAIRHTCEKLGFFMTEKVTVFSCSGEGKSRWDAFMEQKGQRLCKVLERNGYRAVSFQDLEPDLLEQIRSSDSTAYANSFHPAEFLDNPARKMSWDLSYATVKDGTVAAYCLVSMPDHKSAVFEQISVSSDEMGQGVILQPFVSSMTRFVERKLERACYAMYGSNRHANAFRNKVLMIFLTIESVMENYCYIPDQAGPIQSRDPEQPDKENI